MSRMTLTGVHLGCGVSGVVAPSARTTEQSRLWKRKRPSFTGGGTGARSCRARQNTLQAPNAIGFPMQAVKVTARTASHNLGEYDDSARVKCPVTVIALS